MTARLQARNLSRRFGGLLAVGGVDLDLEEGKLLGVIGPNGAGKSTLINLITGQLKPTGGRVRVDGRDVTGARPWMIADARVARTFQIVKPFRDLTVRENVAIGSMFGPERAGSTRDALAAADAVLERVGLVDKAKALAMRPRLLLLDEVMAGLRPGEIDGALELIRSLKDEGMTILVVEHVMKAILSVSDSVLVMHEGEELVHGEPQEVMEDERVIEAYLGQRYARRMH